MLREINVLKYHVSCTDGKNSVRIKIEITFIFRLHRRPFQLVMLVVLVMLATEKFHQPTRPADDVKILTKGLQEPT